MARSAVLRIVGGVAVLAIVGVVSWAFVLGTAGDGSPPTPTPSPFPPGPTPTATISLVPVQLVARSGSQLTVTLPGSEKVTLDLHSVPTFDCRNDCLVDVRAMLPPIAPTNRLCVATVSGSPPEVFKLWVNRVAVCQLQSPAR